MSLLLLFNQAQSSGDTGTVGALKPTVLDVANLLRARLTDQGGGSNASFTPDTRPTDSQVQGLIDMASSEVLIGLPITVDTRLYPMTKAMTALSAAILVETSYFPEQVAQGASPVEVFQTRMLAGLAKLVAASQEDQPGGQRAYSVPSSTVVANAWPGLPVETELLP